MAARPAWARRARRSSVTRRRKSRCSRNYPTPLTAPAAAPAKARTGIEGYFRAWERAVQLLGPGQVSTYVILGMGEDPKVTARGCQRAMDIGVYPFIVPLRPVPGSLIEDVPPPAADYMRQVYRQAVPYLRQRGLASWHVKAGCARCNACSAGTVSPGSGHPRARASRAEAADWPMTYARGPSPNPAPLLGGQSTLPQALPALTLTEFVRAIRDGSLSPADLVTEALTSLHRWQPVTTAASQIWPEEALQAARALPADPHLTLAGIPVLVKENMDVAGHKSTACCDAIRDRRAPEDAQLVASLRAAGAIVIGKANMHELAASATGHISACGPMHNPWDPARLAGGSSGGSAAAARSVPFALGTDTAGSIRIPSSFCGVARLKPTQGRLSMRGIMPLAPSLGCAGPVADCAEDLGVAFTILADEPGSVARMREPAAGLMGARARAGYFAEGIHPDVRRAITSAAEVLAAAGLLVTDASLPGMGKRARYLGGT